jgi:SRSO17 transposase
VAGRRWTVECGFQPGKGETGLDHYQVRRYQAWYRHVTLSMLAQGFLAVQPTRAAVDTGGG